MISETDTDRQRTGETRSYVATGTDSLSEAVVCAVSAVSERPRVASEAGAEPLSPLYDTIDPEALDAVFRSLNDGGGTAGRIEFAYCGYDVAVDSTSEIHVAER